MLTLDQILVNALPLCNSTFEPCGLFLDPFVARANHCCDPNAYIITDGPKISFRTFRPIKKDEEICISYTDQSQHFLIRQQRLLTQNLFNCECPKCGKDIACLPDPNGPPEQRVNLTRSANQIKKITPAMRKTYQAISAIRLLEDIKSHEDDTELCMSINIALTDIVRSHVIRFRMGQGDEAQFDGLDNETKIKLLAECMKLLRQLQKWAVTQQPYVNLYHELFYQFLVKPHVVLAFYYGMHIYFNINPTFYPIPSDPRLLVFTFAAAKTVPAFIAEAENGGEGKEYFPSQLGKDFAPLRYSLLKNCFDDVDKAFGENHPFTLQVKKTWAEAGFEESGKEMEEDMAQNFVEPLPLYYKVLEEKIHF